MDWLKVYMFLFLMIHMLLLELLTLILSSSVKVEKGHIEELSDRGVEVGRVRVWGGEQDICKGLQLRESGSGLFGPFWMEPQRGYCEMHWVQHVGWMWGHIGSPWNARVLPRTRAWSIRCDLAMLDCNSHRLYYWVLLNQWLNFDMDGVCLWRGSVVTVL